MARRRATISARFVVFYPKFASHRSLEYCARYSSLFLGNHQSYRDGNPIRRVPRFFDVEEITFDTFRAET